MTLHEQELRREYCERMGHSIIVGSDGFARCLTCGAPLTFSDVIRRVTMLMIMPERADTCITAADIRTIEGGQ